MTVPGAETVRILDGVDGEDPTGRPAGIDVHLEVFQPDAVATADPVATVPRRMAFRTAPLLAILDTGRGRLMVVGHCQVTADSQDVPVFRVLAQSLWLASREGEARRGRRGARAVARVGSARWTMAGGWSPSTAGCGSC